MNIIIAVFFIKKSILPRPMPPLDPNIEIAIKLADKLRMSLKYGLNCSACGSPTALPLQRHRARPAEEVDCLYTKEIKTYENSCTIRKEYRSLLKKAKKGGGGE